MHHEPGNSTGVDRRQFLKGAAAGATALALGAPTTARAQTDDATPSPARNLIIYIGDGLDMGAIPIAQRYCRQRLDRNLHWIDWLASGDARRSMLDTTPADRIVTDSAAAAANWSIGERVNRDALSVTPDGRRPTPLFRLAEAHGFATGAVTNTEILDATPAAMFANAPSRSDIDVIAEQMLSAQFDVLIGGGGRRLTDERLATVEGLQTARTAADLRTALAGWDRVLGLLADSDFPFDLERPDDFPSHAELTTMALRRLASRDKPFALLVESEHIDTSTHMNDAATMTREIVAWDEGLKVCLEFCRARADTLLIVASDHSNSGPTFSCYDDRDVAQFDALCNAPHSFRWLMREYRDRGGDPDTVDLVSLVRDASGVTITADEALTLARWFKGERVDPYNDRNNYFCPLGSVLANHFGVAFSTYHHTTNYIEALSMGPGSERMPHFGHQTQVHGAITQALGLA